MSDDTDDTVDLRATTSSTTPLAFPEATAPAEAPASGESVISGPRIRWAGVIWGLTFAVVGILALRMLLTPAGRDVAYAWTTGLTPLSIVSCVALVVGALLLITGLVGLAHGLQRTRR